MLYVLGWRPNALCGLNSSLSNMTILPPDQHLVLHIFSACSACHRSAASMHPSLPRYSNSIDMTQSACVRPHLTHAINPNPDTPAAWALGHVDKSHTDIAGA
jgi:hypothetical protein